MQLPQYNSSMSNITYKTYSFRQTVIVFFLLTGLLFNSVQTNAQDTAHTKSIKIISSYKPVLKPATKWSFSASPLPSVSSKESVIYRLPDQQFKVIMKPVDLKPAVYVPDSISFVNHHFLKAGYGNFRRIYADAGSSWGAGKPIQVQVMAGHHAIRGDLPFQQNNRSYAGAHVQIYQKNHVLGARASFSRQNLYYYGLDPANINAKKDSLLQTFDHFNIHFDWSNPQPNDLGITWHPTLQASRFSDLSSYELNAVFRVPVSVSIGEKSSFSLLMDADLTRYNPAGASVYDNHIFGVKPSFAFPVRDLTFDAGGRFAWDQGELVFLPQFGMEAFLRSKALILQAGWQSSLQKNNFQQLVDANPWIRQPLLQFNTRKDEIFLGFRGDLPCNFSYRLRGGVTHFHQLPLFINVKQPSVFDVISESSLQTIHLQGSVDWVHSDKLSAHADMDIYQSVRQEKAEHPWHFIPVQVNMSASWKPVNNFILTGKISGWDGPYAQKDLAGTYTKLPAVVDLNVSVDIKVHKLFSLWLEMNNIFNQAYQRWYQYPVVGLQAVGGIRLNFDQIK